MAAILFEIALNIAQQRDVEYCRNDQQYQRAEEHSDGENDGHQEAIGYHVVFAEVFRQIPPLSCLMALGNDERVERQGVDSLARTVR